MTANDESVVDQFGCRRSGTEDLIGRISDGFAEHSGIELAAGDESGL